MAKIVSFNSDLTIQSKQLTTIHQASVSLFVVFFFLFTFFFIYGPIHTIFLPDHQILEMVEAILIVWHIQINWYLVCMCEHILRNLFIKRNFRFYYGVDLLCWISTIQCGWWLKRIGWLSPYCFHRMLNSVKHSRTLICWMWVAEVVSIWNGWIFVATHFCFI